MFVGFHTICKIDAMYDVNQVVVEELPYQVLFVMSLPWTGRYQIFISHIEVEHVLHLENVPSLSHKRCSMSPEHFTQIVYITVITIPNFLNVKLCNFEWCNMFAYTHELRKSGQAILIPKEIKSLPEIIYHFLTVAQEDT